VSAELDDDSAFYHAVRAQAWRAGIEAVKTVWLFHGLAHRAINRVPCSRRQELIDSLRLLPDKARRAQS
jgi:hypothetical protein